VSNRCSFYVGGLLTEDDSVQLLELRKGIIECKNLGGANECKVPVVTQHSSAHCNNYSRPVGDVHRVKEKNNPVKKN